MGDFKGHLLPGAMFILYGIWWIRDVVRHYFRCKLSDRLKDDDSDSPLAKFSVRNCYNRRLQSMLGVLLPSIGIIGEYWTAFDGKGIFHYSNLQHMSMYLGFLIYAVNELLDSTTSSPFTLPGLNRLTLGLAYAFEALLFWFHQHGQNPLEVRVHILLIISCLCCLLGVALECAHEHSPAAAVVRPMFTLVMGTWFVHVGFVLYWPVTGVPWQEHDHEELMLITSMFCWHIGCAVAFVMIFCKFFSAHCAEKYAKVADDDFRVK